MTYLQERKQLFEDKLADGYLDSGLAKEVIGENECAKFIELGIKNLEAHEKIFERITGK